MSFIPFFTGFTEDYTVTTAIVGLVGLFGLPTVSHLSCWPPALLSAV